MRLMRTKNPALHPSDRAPFVIVFGCNHGPLHMTGLLCVQKYRYFCPFFNIYSVSSYTHIQHDSTFSSPKLRKWHPYKWLLSGVRWMVWKGFSSVLAEGWMKINTCTVQKVLRTPCQMLYCTVKHFHRVYTGCERCAVTRQKQNRTHYN